MILVTGAVREEDITFSATGHNHSGGVNGENVPEAAVVFSATGHNHAGGADGENVPEAAVVFSAAGHTHIGGAQGNTLGLDAIRVDEQSAENAGAVTVITAGVEIVALPAMTVAAGDRVMVYAEIQIAKGVTAGDTSVRVDKLAGTATGVWCDDAPYMKHTSYVPASDPLRLALSGMYKITGAGTLTLRLFGESEGSDSTVAAGEADIHALVLRGTG